MMIQGEMNGPCPLPDDIEWHKPPCYFRPIVFLLTTDGSPRMPCWANADGTYEPATGTGFWREYQWMLSIFKAQPAAAIAPSSKKDDALPPEVAAFKVGSKVEFKARRNRKAGVFAVVVAIPYVRGRRKPRWRVKVRREGKDVRGRRFDEQGVFVDDVILLDGMDTPRANIFADWLEEQGHIESAELLRRRFPHVPREE